MSSERQPIDGVCDIESCTADWKCVCHTEAELREEAQRVLADYQKKRQAAEAEAESIVSAAREEAERLAVDAQAKITDFVARRTRMAEQKIALAEVQATAEVRAAAAEAAVKASETILRGQAAAGSAGTLLAKGLAEVRAKLN